MMKTTSTNKQTGAVSLFVVVFFMLLITVITVSFVRLMVADQRQATDNDLSQSALDSAQAGAEDAKRALLKYKQDCFASAAGCKAAANVINSEQCNTGLSSVSGSNSSKEVLVQQSASSRDSILDQAYTCVKMKLTTADYVGTLAANQSQLVPLFSSKTFDRVKLEWFSKEDITQVGPSTSVDLPAVNSAGQVLYSQGQWPVNRPSLLRTQLIQYATSFTLGNFDTVSGDQSNGATMFLYPTKQQNIGPKTFTENDQRKTDLADDPNKKDPLTTPTAISCSASINAGGYACSSVVVLPQAIGASPDKPNERTAYLRLMPLYTGAHFRVTLWNGPINENDSTDPSSPGESVVPFEGVQPLIDSTGRANDLFRRVQTRVNLVDTTFPYPDAAIDLTGNFCKDFAVTTDQYIAGTSACTP
jgi:Tfp pilus assembly protein PilX